MTQTPFYKTGTIVRKPSFRQFIANDLPVIVLCITGLAVAGLDGMVLKNLLLWMSLFVAVCLGYRFVYMKRTVYLITSEQLIHEHGVFHRTRDYIELFRVVDFREESTFLQQLLGIKTVRIYSGDRSTPYLDLVGISGDDGLIPCIRERVNLNKQKNGVYEITNR